MAAVRAFSLKTETPKDSLEQAAGGLGPRPQQRSFLRDALHPQDLASYVVVILQHRTFRLGPDSSIRRLDLLARVALLSNLCWWSAWPELC